MTKERKKYSQQKLYKIAKDSKMKLIEATLRMVLKFIFVFELK